MKCSPKIAILHGWGAGPHLLADLKAQLESLGHCVLLYEMPGYGSRREDRSPESLAELTDDAIERLGEHPIWIGWSLGAMIAMEAASRETGFLCGVLAVCATARFITDQAKRDSLQTLRVALQSNPAKAILRFQRSMPAAEHRRLISRQLAPEIPGKESLLQGLSILERADLRGELGKISIPVRLISGREDSIIPASSGEAVAASIPGSKFCTLPCGHLPFLECPERFLEQVVEFLETIIESNADRKSV